MVKYIKFCAKTQLLLLHSKVSFQKAIHRIRCHDDQIVPEYLLYLFWFFSEHNGFQKIVHTSTITHLTGVMIKSMQIPIPPMSLQKEFQNTVKNIKKINMLQRSSNENLRKFSLSITQKSLKGKILC